MRFLAILFLLAAPIGAAAQIRDSVFADYASYQSFVDEKVYGRDFRSLIQVLGGRDEYTEEQLSGVTGRFLTIYPSNFTRHQVINTRDLGGGFTQEMRVYWRHDGLGYLYYYALLHDRGDALVVIKFNMNSDIDKILAQY